jgi:Protein of unknown function (DUF1779).
MFLSGGTYNKDGFQAINSVFEKSGIEFVRFDICARGKLNDACMTRADFENTGVSILDSIDMNMTKKNSTYYEKNKKITINGSFPEGIMEVAIENIPGSNSPVSEAVVNITQYSNMQNINDMGRKAAECLKEYGCEPSVNYCVTGRINGKLSDFDRIFITDSIMRYAGARKIDSINYNGLMSISGYSDVFPCSVKYNNDRMNINVASRYNSFEDMTYFWIGTPVIGIEY